MSLTELLQELTPTQLYIVNISIAVTLASGLGLLLLACSRRLSLRWRTPLHQAVLLGVLFTPLLPALAGVTGLGQVAVPAAMGASPTPPVDAPPPIQSESTSIAAGVPAIQESTVFDLEASMHTAPATPFLTPSDVFLVGTGTWTLGALLGVIGFIRASRRLRRLLRSASPEGWETIQADLPAAATTACTGPGDGKAPIRLLRSPAATTPFSTGSRRPTIVLPATMTDPGLVRAAVLHELGHITLGHLRQLPTLTLLRIVLWWHPVVRLLIREIENHQEECCDAHVLHQGMEPRRYAGALADLAHLAAETPRLATTLGFIVGRRKLENRIRRIFAGKEIVTLNRTRSTGVVTLSTLLLCLAAAGGTLARAQEPAPPAPTQPTQNQSAAKDARPTLRVYDFNRLIGRKVGKTPNPFAPPVPNDLGKPTAGTLEMDPQLAFIGLLNRLLLPGDETRILPGRANKLIVLAEAQTQRDIEAFRRENTLALLDSTRRVRLTFRYYQLKGPNAAETAAALLGRARIKSAPHVLFSPLTAKQFKAFHTPDPRLTNPQIRTALTPVLTHGTQHHTRMISYIREFDVKIKDARAFADPVVATLQEGLSFDYLPARLDRERLAVLVRIVRRKIERPIPTEKTWVTPSKPLIIQKPKIKVRTVEYRHVCPATGGSSLFAIPRREGGVLLGTLSAKMVRLETAHPVNKR